MRLFRSPHLRFLLRASTLVIAMFAVWWFLLLTPLLGQLRLSTGLVLHLIPGGSGQITTDNDGNWLLQVPVPAFVANQEQVQRVFGGGQGRPPVRVRSLRLAAPRLVPSLFTLTFPLYWAIILAAPWNRRMWRPLLWGTAVLSVLASFSMTLYSVFTVSAKLNLANGPGGKVLEFCEYFNMYVIPYMAPVLLAVALHRELRAQIFSWEAAPQPVAAVPERAAGATRRRRR